MATRTQSSDASGAATRAISAWRDSVLVKLATFGLVLLVAAVAIEGAIRAGVLVRGMSGVWATIFLLWGLSLVVAGVGGRTLIWWRRQ